MRGVVTGDYATILTPEALAFVASLARRHTDTVHELLARRKAVQARYDAGGRPHFLPQTKHVCSLSVLVWTPRACAYLVTVPSGRPALLPTSTGAIVAEAPCQGRKSPRQRC